MTPKTHLRTVLLGLDIIAIALAWILPLVFPFRTTMSDPERDSYPLNVFLYLLGGILGSLGAMAAKRLYKSRVCEMRTQEIILVAHLAPLIAVFSLIGCRLAGEAHLARVPLLTAALFFLFVNIGRMGFRHWLLNARQQGRFVRNVILIGANEQGLALYKLLKRSPELGFRIRGVIGSRDDMRQHLFDVPWLGDGSDLDTVLRTTGVNGVFVAPQAFDETRLHAITRTLLNHHVHIRITTGIRGIDHRRFRSNSLGYEPVVYLEHVRLEGWQVACKRVMDVAIASAVLIIASPLMLLTAVGIKLRDGGPILFRQERIGHHGNRFRMMKFRSMVINADAQLEQLKKNNVRQGPLFKLQSDPRVTGIGRVLRATSIDELPQLFNVLRGDMSLVGPRPALPSEVAQFDEAHLVRHHVKPGITGLWQVEARDDPSFESYQRFDVFYVENWSVLLDLSILIATAKVVLVRALRILPGVSRRLRAITVAPVTVLE